MNPISGKVHYSPAISRIKERIPKQDQSIQNSVIPSPVFPQSKSIDRQNYIDIYSKISTYNIRANQTKKVMHSS